MTNSINTHNLIVDFGRYRGERWTRLPLEYLRWLGNQESHNSEIARAEMERRGSVVDMEVEISSHAIDRASEKHLDKWLKEKHMLGGIHHWLHFRACLARDKSKTRQYKNVGQKYKVTDNGMKFLFEKGKLYDKLVSIM